MSNKRQITLPGALSEPRVGSPAQKTITIDLDDQSGTYGHAIGWDLFQTIVTRFHNECKLRDDECTSYVVDKQILHILMSSTKCNSLLLSKCKRHDGKESIAFMALGANGFPVGVTTDPSTNKTVLVDSTSQPPGGEWIQGLTSAEERAKGIMKSDGITETFDFEKYMTEIKSQGQQLALAFQ